MGNDLIIDLLLHELLKKQHLLEYAPALARKSVTKVNDLEDVTNDVLASCNLSKLDIQKLKQAFWDKKFQDKIKKRIKKNEKIQSIDISNIEDSTNLTKKNNIYLVPNTFTHTGHGDSDWAKSWGDIFEKVRKQLPNDTSIENFGRAMIKHQYDPAKAVKDLKVQKIISLNLTKDPELAASTLDACEGNFDEAVNKLTTSMTENISSSVLPIFKKNVELMEELGEGTFTVVKQAKWRKTDSVSVDVAVKIIKQPAKKEIIMKELKIISKLRHPKLFKIHGVVFGDPLLMVLEFCDGGSLWDRLRRKDKLALLATQLMDYSQQIANGMAYLEHEGYVHRHLSTTNVLLCKNEQEIKICDFGLSKLLNKEQTNKVRTRCCPPEVLKSQQFSIASDVWAFGVTLWEMWTNGEIPWADYGYEKILQTLEADEKLRKPENAPNRVYDIMLSCWSLEPEKRQNFKTLYQLLLQIKFDTLFVKSDFFPTIPTEVEVKQKQRFTVLEDRSPTTVFGQNDTTRKYVRPPTPPLRKRSANSDDDSPSHTQTMPNPKSTIAATELSADADKYKLLEEVRKQVPIDTNIEDWHPPTPPLRKRSVNSDDDSPSHTKDSDLVASAIDTDSTEAINKLCLLTLDDTLTLPTSHESILIMKDNLELMEELGEGTFAVIKKAEWNKSVNEKIDVAVKIIKAATEELKQDFMDGIKQMSELNHPNLIEIYGVVPGNKIMLVSKFCDGGSLLDRLRSQEKPKLFATQLLEYSQQIALGMTYLEQKGYVHRYLAARNVLLTKNERQIKICDFDLSRILNNPETKKSPFLWSPPESLKSHRFSSASDVWAFGVTMWEIWANGEEPWIGYGYMEVLKAAETDEILRKPENAPNRVYDIMLSCWALEPEERPNFEAVYELLLEIKFDTFFLKPNFSSVCLASPLVKKTGHVEMKPGQRFIVLEERSSTTVFGQNDTTRKYGLVPKAILSKKPIFAHNLSSNSPQPPPQV